MSLAIVKGCQALVFDIERVMTVIDGCRAPDACSDHHCGSRAGDVLTLEPGRRHGLRRRQQGENAETVATGEVAWREAARVSQLCDVGSLDGSWARQSRQRKVSH